MFFKIQFWAVPSLQEEIIKGDNSAPLKDILYSSLHKVIVQELNINLKFLSCSSAGTSVMHEMEGKAVCIVGGFFLCSCFPVVGNNQVYFQML